MPSRHDETRTPPRTGALAAAIALALLLPAATAQEREDRIETARATLEKWLLTQQLIAKEKADWALGRQTLQDQIELVQRELDAERARLETATASLADAAGVLEQRTRELLLRLPEPIRVRVRPLSQRLPEKPEEQRPALGPRFETVVGLLNEVDKFQREVTLTSEVRELGDGTAAEVTALYLGLGQGWYVGVGGRVAGVGRAEPEGWTWSALNGAAPAVAEAIAILKNEKVARFVPLPLGVR
jgi:hypothetical protein